VQEARGAEVVEVGALVLLEALEALVVKVDA
jgi:hypothetical protein